MQNMGSNNFLIGLTSICLTMSLVFSCSGKRSLTEAELKLFVQNPENGLIKKIEKNGTLIEMVYRPKELIVAQEVGFQDPVKWKEEMNKLDSIEYFILKLSRNNDEIENSYASNSDRYNAVLNYLNGPVSNDIHINIDDQKIKAQFAIFSPSFGSSTATSVMLQFKYDLDETGESFEIIFDDGVIGLGRCVFTFQGSEIREIPKLLKN